MHTVLDILLTVFIALDVLTNTMLHRYAACCLLSFIPKSRPIGLVLIVNHARYLLNITVARRKKQLPERQNVVETGHLARFSRCC